MREANQNAMAEAKAVVERAALQRLQEITVKLLGQLELDPLLESILSGVVELLDADHGHLYRYDAESDALRTWIPLRLPAGIEEVVLGRGEGAAGTVLETDRPVRVDDYDSWDRRSPMIPRGGSGPVIAVPVRRGKELLGVIVADRSPGGNRFEDQDVKHLQLFANQAAVAIANAQLYEAAKRSAEEMTQLYDTSLDIVQELELTRVLRAILDRANLLLDAQSANLRLHDPEQNLLVPAVPPADDDQFGAVSLIPGEGVSGQAFASGEPVVVDDHDTSDARSPKFPAGIFARVMAVPVKRGSEVIGALAVERGKDHPRFNDEEIRLLSLFANQAGVAVQNAQLFQKAQDQSKELAHLYDTSLDITSTLDLSTVIESVIRRSADVVEAQVGEVVVFDPERGVTTAFLSIGLDEAGLPLSPHEVGQPPEGLDGLVISTGKPLRIDDYDAWPQRLSVAPMGVVGPIMGVPIVHRSEVLGSLSLVRSSGGPPFTDEDERLLILFANQAAVAIANARTFEAADQRRRELAHLYDTSLDISSDLDLPKVLEAVMRRTADLVEAHAGQVVVRDPAQGTVAAHYHLGFEEAAIPLGVQEVGAPPKGLTAQVIATGRPIRLDDYGSWPQRVASVPRDAIGPIIGIPLLHQGELLGCLLLGRKPGGPPFTSGDERRLLLFANQAAVAIQNARQVEELQRLHQEHLEKERMDRELSVAREIQTSLLPEHLPSIPGWDAAAHWHPALEIAGDFYDFIPLEDSRWAVVVGDVADKGVPAALLMSLTRSLFHAYAGMGMEPHEVLSRVNGEILEHSRSGMFVTALYAILNGQSNTLEIFNAGHHPALVHRRRAQRVESVRMAGIALGIVEEPTFGGKTLRLSKGDRIFLYTDGVTDARNAEDEEFGQDRLVEFVRGAPRGSSQRALDALHETVETFAQGTAQFDDFTYIVLTRRS
ncbi:MAG: GAF domain-containing protein [Anaerolineae bacterium]